MPGHRSDCFFCKTSVLSNSLGLHILRKHEAELLTKENLKLGLHKDKYLKEPLQLFVGDDTYFFCLADNSCIKKPIQAENHFKGKEALHREAVLKLREKYPLDGSAVVETKSEPLLTKKELKEIQDEICLLFQHQVDNKIEVYEFSKKSKAYLRRLGISVDFDEITAEYPHCFPEPEEEEEEEPPAEEQYEEPPAPPEETEETEEHLPPPPPPYIPPPPPSASHYSIPRPRQDTFLFRQPAPPPAFPSVKIIQNSKRPSPSGAL